MGKRKTKPIRKTIGQVFTLADKYYEEGDYASALRWCFRLCRSDRAIQYDVLHECYPRIVDCYEAMGLYATAIHWLYLWLNEIDEDDDEDILLDWREDLPDIYESLGVNYLNLGKESASAYYYNKLIDVDDTLPPEAKIEIAETFAKPKESRFRFVYPPRLADYSEEMDKGAHALKEGNGKRAIKYFSRIEKGSKEYVGAKEMQAVAHLLIGETDLAQKACEEILQEKPEDVRAMATLCAVYLEKGETSESERIADMLCSLDVQDTDEIYKIATVCCETGRHEEAFKRFCILSKELPYDTRTLYFKAVSAWKSGNYKQAEIALDVICSIYPYAEVAKYYRDALRSYRYGIENGETPSLPEPSYFYALPQKEREARCQRLIDVSKLDLHKEHGEVRPHEGEYSETKSDILWCFDELDGADHDLQYLGLVSAFKACRWHIIQEYLLDPEGLDAFKIEMLRIHYELNQGWTCSFVLCDIYRTMEMLPIKIGLKRRKKFINAYAKVASKFAPINDAYGKKLKEGAETLYKKLKEAQLLEEVDNEDDLACAIFVSAGIKEIYGNFEAVCAMLDGKPEKVQRLLSVLQKNKEEQED